MSESTNAMLEKAIEVAVVAHAGRTDKNGEAYILHPLRVMLAVRAHRGSIEQQTAAVLHDVIEDCDVPDDFLASRFPAEVCDLVDALTRIDGESYDTYLRRVSRTPGALLIKEADVQDNYARLHLVQDQDVRDELKTKYERALRVLKMLAPAEGKLGFLRITVAVGEALVLCSEIDLQVLVVEGIKGGQINYRLQNQPIEVMSQRSFVVRVGGERVTMRLAIVGSSQVEALVDALPASIRVVREERITWPAVAVSELPNMPTPHVFHWSVGETIRFKGPRCVDGRGHA